MKTSCPESPCCPSGDLSMRRREAFVPQSNFQSKKREKKWFTPPSSRDREAPTSSMKATLPLHALVAPLDTTFCSQHLLRARFLANSSNDIYFVTKKLHHFQDHGAPTTTNPQDAQRWNPRPASAMLFPSPTRPCFDRTPKSVLDTLFCCSQHRMSSWRVGKV